MPPPEEPDSEDQDERITPLFPLRGVLLFPGLIQPLQVFEPRYIQMVRDSLDTRGEIVLGTVLGASEEEMGGSPPVEPVAGFGRIEHYRYQDDGRIHILLRGISRVVVTEVPSHHLYRLVSCSELPEVTCTPQESAELKPQLLDALNRRAQRDLDIPDGLSVAQLSDLLLALLALPQERQHELYAETAVSERARAVLAHERD